MKPESSSTAACDAGEPPRPGAALAGGPGYAFAKRTLDVVLAAAIGVAVLPVCLVIMAALAVTGEREVFYSQTRVGLRGRRFRLLKFATMLKNSADIGTGTITVPQDPRVLPVGRFLRKTKLNELPQIWNVLRGDMSLVGPRPLAEQDFAYYTPHVRERITMVRPGLTGVGSLVFRDEEGAIAHSDLPPVSAYRTEIAPRKGRLELWYLQNRCLTLDLKLLALTAAAVLAPNSRIHERVLPDLAAVADG